MKLILGNCIEKMFSEIEPESIDLTVTSPPYDNLRTYNNSSTWGWYEFTAIAAGLWRVTKPGGVVVWVVNDATIKGSETGTSFRQAMFFKEIGFNLHDTMIYKTDKMPLNHNRYDPCFEYMFILSKGKPKTFEPLMVKCKKFGGSKNYKDSNLSASAKESCSSYKRKDKIIPYKEFKMMNNIWNIGSGNMQSTTDKIAFQNPAIFPEKLANDHIISWSNEGDTVFDPMMGSGTTGKMAILNNRDFIGIEIDHEYFEIAKKRIEEAQQRKQQGSMSKHIQLWSL